MPYCYKCGKPLFDDSEFCTGCGAPVRSATAQHDGASRREVYQGTVYKCPKCGENLRSFATVCPTCGYELRGVGTSSCVEDLAKQFSRTSSADERVELIRTFHIPNTKEDIYEFFILATSNASTTTGPEADAWMAKLDQAYQKAKLVINDRSEVKRLEKLRRDARKEQQRKAIGSALTNPAVVLAVLFFVFMAAAAYAYFVLDSPYTVLPMVIGLYIGIFALGLITQTEEKKKKKKKNKWR